MTDYPTQVLIQAGRLEESDLLEHLLIDRLIKLAIVIVVLLILALGMRIIWKKTRRNDEP
jgi:hypothetical protein